MPFPGEFQERSLCEEHPGFSLAFIMALSLSSVAPFALNLATPPSKPAASTTDFCYGLPGNIAPAGNWDPANLLDGASKGEVRSHPHRLARHARLPRVCGRIV